MPLKNRWVGNPVLSGVGRLFFECPCRDFHCGLRGFSNQAFRRLDLRTTGMEYASEMVIKATLLKMRIAEVPTKLHPAGRSRAPHLRPWRDGWRHLRFMLMYSPTWLYLYPGLSLTIVGGLVMAWLYTGPKRVGMVGLDVHTMLFAAMAVLLGFQSLGFAIFTKVFAVSEGLLPEQAWVRRVLSWMRLETGLAAGAVVAVGGLAWALAALWGWRATGFRQLDPQEMMRSVIPSVVLLTLGCEVLLASFFLSILGLALRRDLPEVHLVKDHREVRRPVSARARGASGGTAGR
jgi:hypothetical protein